MTQIFLVRHGEAEGNLYRRAQGCYDAPLTSRGRHQLNALAERFRTVPIQAAYSSDLRRAYETAAAAVRFAGVPVVKDQRLREIHLGDWENRPWGNIQHEEPEQMRLFSFDPERWSISGSEPFSETQERMKEALTQIASSHDGQTVVVASHGMAIRALLASLLGIPSNRIREVVHSDNTSVARLVAEHGKFRVEYFNDNSHLPKNLSTFARQDWWQTNSGLDSTSLRFRAFDLETGKNLYLACYRDAWQTAHGSLRGFDEESCLKGAEYRASSSGGALLEALQGDSFAGLLALDERRGAASGVGWLSFVYVLPSLRRSHLGIQLVGCAVARYRELGRRLLHLAVAPSNPALEFYRKAGFQEAGREPGAAEPLLLMEMGL